MKKRLEAWGDSYILPIVCCVILNEKGEVLFLRRHSEDLGGGKWGFPGGRIDKGESLESAIVREVKEETGIVLATPAKIGEHEIHMPHGIVHMITYQSSVKSDTPIVLDPVEHEDYQWLKPAATLEVQDMLYGVPSLLRDFGLLDDFPADPTLPGGSKVINLKEI